MLLPFRLPKTNQTGKSFIDKVFFYCCLYGFMMVAMNRKIIREAATENCFG
jgi:hypothetical protein